MLLQTYLILRFSENWLLRKSGHHVPKTLKPEIYFVGFYVVDSQLCVAKKIGGPSISHRDMDQKHHKGDLESRIFDFRKKWEFLISAGSGSITRLFRNIVPYNKWYSFFFKIVYHLWNCDAWLFFYRRCSNGNI